MHEDDFDIEIQCEEVFFEYDIIEKENELLHEEDC